MKEPNTAADLLRKIANSAGSGYLNQAHQRSFSLNVFRMNAVELIEAAQRVKDPDQGMALMMERIAKPDGRPIGSPAVTSIISFHPH